jgi:formate hydrogenlyase subunit 3/multisubunit Na+/H+ antiporter MnhD subunit
VASIQSLRGRLPFIVFVFVLVIAVVMIGFACVCIADHPGKALDRASSTTPAGTPVIEMWPLIVLLLGPVLMFVIPPRRAQGRASPSLLQRFLF